MDYIQHLVKNSSLGEEEKRMTNQSQSQIIFRSKLWNEFVAGYQVVLVSAPETFSDFCAKFRERWIRGF